MEFAAIYGPAQDFLRRHAGKEVLIVAMERGAADHVVRKYGGSQSGIRRYSLRQLITADRRPERIGPSSLSPAPQHDRPSFDGDTA
jgi:hypothetical protein